MPIDETPMMHQVISSLVERSLEEALFENPPWKAAVRALAQEVGPLSGSGVLTL